MPYYHRIAEYFRRLPAILNVIPFIAEGNIAMSTSICNQLKKVPFSGSNREQTYKFLLLMALASFCNESRADGHCWPSIRAIMKIIRCARSTVFKYLRLLEEEGWFQRVPRLHRNKRQTSNEYYLNLEMIKNKATILIHHDDRVMTQDEITLDEMFEILKGNIVDNYEDNIVPEVDKMPDIVRPADPSKGNQDFNILNPNLKGQNYVDNPERGEPETKIRAECIKAMRESLQKVEISSHRRH